MVERKGLIISTGRLDFIWREIEGKGRVKATIGMPCRDYRYSLYYIKLCSSAGSADQTYH